MHSIHKRFGVIAGFLILLVLLAVNAAVLRHQLSVQVGNQEWFSHSRRVVQELRNTESLVRDAETGQRGYLYTERPGYLAPTPWPRLKSMRTLKTLRLWSATTPGSKPRLPNWEF